MFKQICIIIIVLITASGCAAPNATGPQIDKVSLEKEREYQKEFSKSKTFKAKKKYSAAEKAKFYQRLSRVSQKIAKGGEQVCREITEEGTNCVYEFELENDGPVNAYADGEKIMVTPAMMDFMDSDSEIAVILGHEYAHNAMGHIKSQKLNTLVGGIAGMALDMTTRVAVGLDTGGAFSKVGAGLGRGSYSQDFEREADYVGLYIMARAGYDIKKAPLVWRKMSINNKKAVYSASTHPTNPERYLKLEKAVKEISTKKKSKSPLLPDVDKKDES